MRWIDALRIWNQDNGGKWCIPRSGTPEHAQVLEIMKQGGASKPAPNKRIKFKIKQQTKPEPKPEPKKELTIIEELDNLLGQIKPNRNKKEMEDSFQKILREGGVTFTGNPKRRRRKKQVGGMSVWDLPEFRNEFKKHTPADLRQMGYGMDDTERNLRIRSMFKNTYGQDALDNYDKQQGNGMILPGRQQRGRGADLPWDVILDVVQNPMSYVNKAGKFLDSTSGTKQMAEQIERETGAKRLFKWPWEN